MGQNKSLQILRHPGFGFAIFWHLSKKDSYREISLLIPFLLISFTWDVDNIYRAKEMP